MTTKTFCDVCEKEMEARKGYTLIGGFKGISRIFCSIECLEKFLEILKRIPKKRRLWEKITGGRE